MSAPDQRSEAAIAAFNAGYQAFENAERRLIPEELAPALHQDWIDGWETAEKDFARESEMDEKDLRFLRRYD